MHKDPRQTWSDYLRTLVAFGLGVAIIVYAIAKKGAEVNLLILGLLLMGVVPVDAILVRLGLGRAAGGEQAPAPTSSDKPPDRGVTG